MKTCKHEKKEIAHCDMKTEEGYHYISYVIKCFDGCGEVLEEDAADYINTLQSELDRQWEMLEQAVKTIAAATRESEDLQAELEQTHHDGYDINGLREEREKLQNNLDGWQKLAVDLQSELDQARKWARLWKRLAKDRNWKYSVYRIASGYFSKYLIPDIKENNMVIRLLREIEAVEHSND